jgi:hypothetical protein
MSMSPAILGKVYKALNRSAYDLAAGLHEDSLNDFLAAHWKSEGTGPGSVYIGGGRLTELEMNYEYVVDAPARIELAPLTDAQFKRVFSLWLPTVPELGRYLQLPAELAEGVAALGSIADRPPPNVRVTVPAIKIKIVTDPGPQVTLPLRVRITGYVALVNEAGSHVVRIVPVAVKLEDPNRVERLLDEQLAKLFKAQTSEKDDPDCVALKKVILHIVNVVLANRIGSFVQSFTLPLPIGLFNGVSISDVALNIGDKLLVVLARVSAVRFEQMLDLFTEASDLKPEAVVPFADRVSKAAEKGAESTTGSNRKAVSTTSLPRIAKFPNRGLFLWMHQRFFQTLAQKLLVLDQHDEHYGEWTIFKYGYGWFLRTWAPMASVSANALDVALQFQGGGWAKGCIETHCGDLCHTISARAKAQPAAQVETAFYFESNQELWMASRLSKPFAILWDVDGLPWPFNDLVAFIFDVFSNYGEIFAIILGQQWRRKLLTIPTQFPGTGLKFGVKFDKQIVKDPEDTALMALGEIHFSP